MDTVELDLRAVPAEEGAKNLRTAFDALPLGGTLTILSASDPRKVIREFMTTHWGRFDWAPLKAGDGDFISSFVKRELPGPNGLLEMLSADHQRCDTLFADAENAAQEGNLERTLELYRRYALGMERHFTIEEEGFFAEFDRRMGTEGGGPVAVMREEHQQIRGMLNRLGEALNQQDLEDYLAASETLLYLMEQHNMKEEQMLYPMADDLFGTDVEELLKQLFLY